jgi:hypothetical protein
MAGQDPPNVEEYCRERKNDADQDADQNRPPIHSGLSTGLGASRGIRNPSLIAFLNPASTIVLMTATTSEPWVPGERRARLRAQND